MLFSALKARLRAEAAAPSSAPPASTPTAPAPAPRARIRARDEPATSADSRAPPPEDGHELQLGERADGGAEGAEGSAGAGAALERFVVSRGAGPQRCCYVPDAVGAAHAAALLAAIDDASHADVWVELRARRLQQWAAPLPAFL
jgi:hypothetical protein